MHTECSHTNHSPSHNSVKTIVELTLISRCLPAKHLQLITCFPTLDKHPGSFVQNIIGRDVKRPPYKFCNIIDVWSFSVTTNAFMKLFFENYDWKRRKD